MGQEGQPIVDDVVCRQNGALDRWKGGWTHPLQSFCVEDIVAY